MTCKACGAAAGLKTCLFCGHGACPSHRAEVDGATACTPCFEAEQARKKRVSESAKLAAAGGSDRLPSPGMAAAATPGEPLAPLPEPGGGGLLATAAAGVVTLPAVLYLRWLHGTLELDPEVVPGWAGTAGIAAGGVFVFCGVWIIVKSRAAR